MGIFIDSASITGIQKWFNMGVIDGVRSNEVVSVVLRHDEKWEGEVGFVPEQVGGNQKVEVLLGGGGSVLFGAASPVAGCNAIE